MATFVDIDQEACIGCGKCVKLCPRKILYMNAETGTCGVTDHAKCDRRAGCEMVCPVSAIKIR